MGLCLMFIVPFKVITRIKIVGFLFQSFLVFTVNPNFEFGAVFPVPRFNDRKKMSVKRLQLRLGVVFSERLVFRGNKWNGTNY